MKELNDNNKLRQFVRAFNLEEKDLNERARRLISETAPKHGTKITSYRFLSFPNN